MATKRKAWFRVYDSILREDWDDRTTATVIRLLAWMHQRWWRDGLTIEGASTAYIGPVDCMAITRLQRPKDAAKFLASLPLVAGLRSASAQLVTIKGTTSVSLDWPKFAELQEVAAPKTPGHGKRNALSYPETETLSSSKQEEREADPEKPAGEAPSAVRPAKSKAVERFDPLNLARYGLDTLTVSTANDLLNVHPRGPRETPETLATWFAWIAPKMRLKGYRDLNRTARNWWPNLKREDVEKSREWLQVRCLSDALEARKRREREAPLVEIPTEDYEDLFREAGL